MIHKRIATALLVVFAAVSGNLQGAERGRGHSLGAPAPAIGKVLQPAWTAISPAARIFLVAGARDSANFAQEVVDQRKYWLAQGYSTNQIECFFATPSPVQQDDAEQFLSLEEALQDCHLAAPDIIFSALAEVAQNYQQDFFYLYVTSHGTDPPLTHPLPPQVLNNPDAAWFVEARAEAKADPLSLAYQWLSPFRMEVEGAGNASNWGWAPFTSRYLNARQNPGVRVEDQLFTPKYLANALRKFPASVKKVVVLQACHSGGFLLPPGEAPAPDETLVDVENITVLTAARADRTSFGCDTSDHTTYYGGALQEVLDASPGEEVRARDWHRVHEEVADKVQDLEARQKIPRDQRSLPQYFSNAPGSK
ncbi:MAG: C13 family peptidase [Pseudomonadota bacterium]